MTFGEPVDLGQRPWPRTQQDVADAAARVTDAILQTIRDGRGGDRHDPARPARPQALRRREHEHP